MNSPSLTAPTANRKAPKARFRVLGRKDGLVDRVVGEIERQILEGSMDVGTRLPPEREFSERLGVSRTVVREAVCILVTKGLLETRHGIGTTVRAVTREEVVKPLTLFLRTCGDSAPQIQEAHRQLGLKVFAYGPSLYEHRRHIAYYANMLCVSLPLVSEEFTYKGEGPAKLDGFAAAGENLINVRFHPCRFLSDEWWSILNYLNNPDPPTRPPYQHALHLPPEETDQRIRRLGELVDYAREKYGVEFTTYDELWRRTPRNPAFLSRMQVQEAARAVRERLSYVHVDWATLNLAEAFGAIIWANVHHDAEQVPLRHLVGPAAMPRPETAKTGVRLTADDIVLACREAEEEIESKGRVPHEVMLSGRPAPPAALLKAAAARLLGDTEIKVEDAPLFPEGFDDMLRQWDEASFDLVAFFSNRNRPVPNTKLAIKLQYWTYKPGE